MFHFSCAYLKLAIADFFKVQFQVILNTEQCMSSGTTRLLFSPPGSGHGVLKWKHRGHKAAIVEVIACKGDFRLIDISCPS